MKKIISVIVAVIMLSATFCTAAFAEVEYVSPGSIIVPYTSGDNITIDGTLAQGEWSETNKLQLNETNLVNWTTPFVGPIDFYYSWGDKGLYIAAVVSDELMGTTGSQIDPDGGAGGGTRFQLAFNLSKTRIRLSVEVMCHCKISSPTHNIKFNMTKYNELGNNL